MTALDFYALAQISAGRMLNTLVEGVVIAAFAWLVLRLMGNQNSGTRFAVWFSALLSIAALPFFFTPGGEVLSANASHVGVTLPGSLGIYLFAVWLFIATIFLARLGLSLRHVRNLRRNAAELEPAAIDPALANVFKEFVAKRRVTLCVSDSVRVPAAVGFFRPAVIVPRWALQELPAEDLKAVLLHELAHLQRWDDWTNLAQKVLKSLFFFHPAVWWIERRLTLEREMACDDMVLAQTENPRAYASSLLVFAERVSGARGLALAQAVVGRVRQISLRIRQILNVNRPKTTRVWKPVLALLGTASVLAFVATPYTPKLIAFENQKPNVMQVAAQPDNSAPMIPSTVKAVQAKYVPAAKKENTVARAVRPRNQEAKPIQAKQTIEAQDVVFVMQSVQYDMSGNAVWTTCVWRMSQAGEVQKKMQRTVVMSKL